MDQFLSKEARFIKVIKASLRERGVGVKKKDLTEFFIFISDLCPWVVFEGPHINVKTWEKVGEELNAHLEEKGPSAIPVRIFSYWSLIRDILSESPGSAHIISAAESFLRRLSRSSLVASQKIEDPSPCPFDILDIPPCDDHPSDKDPKKSKNIQSIYPNLPKTSSKKLQHDPTDSPSKIFPVPSKRPNSDKLSPSEEEELDETAAAYRNPDWRPLATTVLPESSQGPSAPFLPSPADEFLLQTKRRLTKQVRQLKDVLHLQKELADLTLNVNQLQTAIVQSHSGGNYKTLRWRTGDNLNIRRHHVDASAEEGSESDDTADEGQALVEFKKLKFKSLKDLHSAVRNYGHNAPFTLSILDFLSGDCHLLANEWYCIAQAVLSRPQYLTWKADFLDRCEQLARQNAKRTATNSWTADKLSGQGKYNTEKRQINLPLGILAQTTVAALGAWRSVPSDKSMITPLTKIFQSPQEPYIEFIGRLLETAERTIGAGDKDDPFLKLLAYENANAACRAVLRGRYKNKTLNEMIKLCNGVDSFSFTLSKGVSLAIGALIQNQRQPNDRNTKTCFRCGRSGHFARQCGTLPINSLTWSAGSTVPNAPRSVCPRCKRGKHWANQCRSQTDASGNPLAPIQGNRLSFLYH